MSNTTFPFVVEKRNGQKSHSELQLIHFLIMLKNSLSFPQILTFRSKMVSKAKILCLEVRTLMLFTKYFPCVNEVFRDQTPNHVSFGGWLGIQYSFLYKYSL